ncbi:MAG: class I SAM-dependent methyltransferase [Myxococcota bacterium]
MATSEIEDQVRAQYEQYPYPLRSPDEDAIQVARDLAPLESLRIIQHFGFGGQLPDRPLRILVAGGGTGDATLQLGWQLQGTPHGGEIVHLDLSEAAIEVALQRVERMGVRNVTVHRGSLLEATPEDLGQFDYINCSGVLHHLPDPWAGAEALRGLLSDQGVMGIMVYGRYGRNGLYSGQALLRRLTSRYSLADRVAIARRVLPQLPAQHPLASSRMRFTERLSDNEIVDRFLHSCDRAFTVPEVVGWMGDTDMRVIDFVPGIRYAAALLVADPWVLKQLAGMPLFDRYAVAELWAYHLDRHSFFAVRDDNPIAPLEPGPDVVATVREPTVLMEQLQNTKAFDLTSGGSVFRVPLAPTDLHLRILGELDGKRTLGTIAAAMQVSWARFLDVFRDVYTPLQGGHLTLSTRR